MDVDQSHIHGPGMDDIPPPWAVAAVPVPNQRVIVPPGLRIGMARPRVQE